MNWEARIPMKFQGKVQLNGKTATGIPVPEKVVQTLRAGKRPLVVVKLAGSYTYRSSLANMGGSGYMLPVSGDVRAATGLAAGDAVEVELQVDTAPREVAVPGDLRKALARDPAVKAAFDRLSNSKKQRLTLPIENAKTQETRQRNVDKAIRRLHDGTI
jgi:Domain of unknown function (DUF1905)/Bacteriocin-protection, YdeI or OmpD-Associated